MCCCLFVPVRSLAAHNLSVHNRTVYKLNECRTNNCVCVLFVVFSHLAPLGSCLPLAANLQLTGGFGHRPVRQTAQILRYSN